MNNISIEILEKEDIKYFINKGKYIEALYSLSCFIIKRRK